MLRAGLSCCPGERQHARPEQRERCQRKGLAGHVDGERDRVRGLDRVDVGGHQVDGAVAAELDQAAGDPGRGPRAGEERAGSRGGAVAAQPVPGEGRDRGQAQESRDRDRGVEPLLRQRGDQPPVIDVLPQRQRHGRPEPGAAGSRSLPAPPGCTRPRRRRTRPPLARPRRRPSRHDSWRGTARSAALPSRPPSDYGPETASVPATGLVAASTGILRAWAFRLRRRQGMRTAAAAWFRKAARDQIPGDQAGEAKRCPAGDGGFTAIGVRGTIPRC